MPMPKFAVAYLPYLSNQHFTPVQLATALARLGYGRLVRADYTRHGIFAYIAHTGWRIHMALGLPNGIRLMTHSAYGPLTCVHLLQARGWTTRSRKGKPFIIGRHTASFDVECPDAGEGSWANWESKVAVIPVTMEGEGFYELMPDPTVVMLRERRWPPRR